jgi:hypothetical protein
VRDAVSSAQSIRSVADAVEKLSLSHDDRTALASRCGAPTQAGVDPALFVDQAIEARILYVWTAGQIEALYGLAPDRLADAWAQTPADDRALFATWCAQAFDTAPPADQLRALTRRLGLEGADAASLTGYYAGARALFEQLGGTV